jgi:hypothetical protein
MFEDIVVVICFSLKLDNEKMPRHPSFLLKIKKKTYFTSLSLLLSLSPLFFLSLSFSFSLFLYLSPSLLLSLSLGEEGVRTLASITNQRSKV